MSSGELNHNSVSSVKTLEDYVSDANYRSLNTYVPSQFSLELVNLIKLIHNGNTENKTPNMHYKLIDSFLEANTILNVVFRGGAKSSLIRYLFWFIAIYGKLPDYGKINFMMYVTDTMENGVKTMRNNLEYMYNQSTFLQKYVHASFTDPRWEFKSVDGHNLVIKGFGVGTAMRGLNEFGVRPQLAVLDDLMSDKNAESPTIVEDIETTIYDAVRPALHPQKRKIIWIGTPFNKNDPLYKAAASGEWKVNAFPVCEEFPCEKKDFIGAWEDRFPYDFVKNEYNHLLKMGKIASFNKEMMLRIISKEDRLIPEENIVWYDRDYVLENKKKYNFYITTDFAVSQKQGADPSAISVWAYSKDKEWLWIDGIFKRQTMDKNLDDLFRFVKIYKPQQVGIETSGQQQGFIAWIKQRMVSNNIFFSIAKNKPDAKGRSEEGFRSSKDKLTRLSLTLPFFSLQLIKFPKQLQNSLIMKEAMDELMYVTPKGIKSKHDDFLDTVSQLALFIPLIPVDDGVNEGSVIIDYESSKYFNNDLNNNEDIDSPLESYLP